VAGKNSIGQEFDPYDVVRVYPMYADDVVKSWGEDGITSLATVLLPNILGVGYGNYGSKANAAPIEETIERNTRADEADFSKIKNNKKGGVLITESEFEEFAKEKNKLVENAIKKWKDTPKSFLDSKNNIVKKTYSQATKDDVIKETSSIKQRIDKQLKEQMFGKEHKTYDERIAEKKLAREKKEENKQ